MKNRIFLVPIITVVVLLIGGVVWFMSGESEDQVATSETTQSETAEQLPANTGQDSAESTQPAPRQVQPAPCGLTASRFEGPYYVSGAPTLNDGNLNYDNFPGQELVLSGSVYLGDDTSQPVANAEIDLWQADNNGDYWPQGNGPASDYGDDEVSLRGVVTTDQNGFYEVRTIMPSEYSEGGGGRPRHMHVKVRTDQTDEFTTQLYWQLSGDQYVVSDTDMDPESQPCQILEAEEESPNVFSSSYDFFIE